MLMSKRKRRLSIKKIIRLILKIFILSFLCYIGFKYINSFNKEETPNNKEKVKKEDSITLLMVGDNLIHDKIYNEAKRLSSNNTYDFSSMYDLIPSKDYDLAYYNQETILGGEEIGLSSYPAFNSPHEVGDALTSQGFNLVSLATNHTLDRGEEAIINSRNYWNSKDNVLAVGSYLSKEERNKVVIKEVNNITYTILNYTYGTNGINIPEGMDYLVNIWPCKYNNPDNDIEYQNYKEIVKEDIDKVRDKTDVLIVAMHWGVEYEFIPNSYQKDMAKYLSSLGVDIIIGTHPHVIQPIEYIDNTLVIYSLGNFISAHETVNVANRIGLMTTLKITKDSNNKIIISNLENDLLYTYYTYDYKNFKVIPFSNSKILDIDIDHNKLYTEYSSIVKSLDDTIYVKPLYK